MSGIGPVLQDFLQDGRVLQKRIPHLEAPHVEIEAPAHCLIHAGDTIGDLWREAGSVDKRIGGCLTSQPRRTISSTTSGTRKVSRQGSPGAFWYRLSATLTSVSRPDRSAVRKTADLGRPILGPRIVSTSPTVYPSSSARCSVDIELYTPMRLAIKLGVSLHSTTPLPSTSLANCCMYCTSSGSVSTPGTISSRRM